MKSVIIIAFGLVVLAAVSAANPMQAEEDQAADEVELALEEGGKLKFLVA